MGLESGIWDDSALLRAFDHAMTKYKVMHGMSQRNADDGSKDEQEVKDEEAVLDESKNTEADNENDDILHVPSELYKACETLVETPNVLDTGLDNVEANVQESYNCNCTSGGPTSSEQHDGSVIPEVEYNQLIARYKELEIQKQQVLEQIYQSSYPNYQPSSVGCASSFHWNPCCCSYLPQHDHTYQPIHPCFQSACYPCSCQYMSFPCQYASPHPFTTSYPTDVPCVNYNTRATDPASSMAVNPCSVDVDVVSTGVTAAESFVASMKTITPEPNKPCEDEHATLHNSSDTGLSDLLNAWYSVGVFTGKYLAERSIEKRSS